MRVHQFTLALAEPASDRLEALLDDIDRAAVAATTELHRTPAPDTGPVAFPVVSPFTQRALAAELPSKVYR